MFQTRSLTKAFAGTLVLASLALTGCGKTTVTAASPNLKASSAVAAANSYTGSSAGSNSAAASNLAATTPVATPQPAAASAAAAPLTASITKKKNGTLLGIGKYVVTVEVSNPAQVQQKGTLTVTFTNGKSKKTVATETREISLAAGATETLTIENKKWSTDDATIEITTDTP